MSDTKQMQVKHGKGVGEIVNHVLQAWEEATGKKKHWTSFTDLPSMALTVPCFFVLIDAVGSARCVCI